MKYVMTLIAGLVILFVVLGLEQIYSEPEKIAVDAEQSRPKHQKSSSSQDIGLAVEPQKKEALLSEEQCLDLLNEIDTPVMANAIKKAKLSAFFNGLPRTQATPENIAKMASYAGVDISELTVSERNRHFVPDQRLSRPEDTYSIYLKKGAKVVGWLMNGQFAELTKAIVSNEIPANGYLMEKSLLSLALDYKPNIKHADLVALLEAGVSLRLPELIAASRKDVSLEALNTIVQYSDFDFTQVWFDGLRYQSLATIAAAELNLPAIKFWQSKGAPLFNDDKSMNVLAFVPQPKGPASYQQGQEIIQYLIANQRSSISPFAKDKLVRWYGKLAAEIDSGEPLSDSANFELTSHVERLVGIVASSDVAVNKALNLEKECIEPLHDSIKVQAFLESQLFERMEHSEAKKLATPAQRQKKLIANLEQLAQQANEEEIDKADNMMRSILGQSWQDAIAQVESLSQESEDINQDMFGMLVIQAIIRNAPLEIFEQLFAKGAQLPKESAHMLALTNNLKLMVELAPMGLDLHAVDEHGKNALSYSILAPDSQEVFNYLIVNGVAINLEHNKMDALDYALDESQSRREAVDYAIRLVELGAKIKRSHRQRLALLEYHNPAHYSLLRSVIN